MSSSRQKTLPPIKQTCTGKFTGLVRGLSGVERENVDAVGVDPQQAELSELPVSRPAFREELLQLVLS